MRPGELEAIVAEKPLAWMPLGTLEWHGRHLPVGLDAIKAHDICVRAARAGGGAVLPPTYFSPWGMSFPWTFKYSALSFTQYINGTFRNLHKYGFRAVILITGHYPEMQVALLMALAESFMATHNMSVAAVPEFAFCGDIDYFGDHAAKWETSFMKALRPDLVGEDNLADLHDDNWLDLFRKGVRGENPAKHASTELGDEVIELFVRNCVELADALLGPDGKDAARRLHREAASSFFSHYANKVKDVIKRNAGL